MGENEWSFILGIRELIEMYPKCVSKGPKSQTANKLQHRESGRELVHDNIHTVCTYSATLLVSTVVSIFFC